MEVKTQTDTKVIISLSEEEAGKLRQMLLDRVDLSSEVWAEELETALAEHGVVTRNYVVYEE